MLQFLTNVHHKACWPTTQPCVIAKPAADATITAIATPHTKNAAGVKSRTLQPNHNHHTAAYRAEHTYLCGLATWFLYVTTILPQPAPPIFLLNGARGEWCLVLRSKPCCTLKCTQICVILLQPDQPRQLLLLLYQVPPWAALRAACARQGSTAAHTPWGPPLHMARQAGSSSSSVNNSHQAGRGASGYFCSTCLQVPVMMLTGRLWGLIAAGCGFAGIR